jgi:cytochrome c biogenesis protein ResB
MSEKLGSYKGATENWNPTLARIAEIIGAIPIMITVVLGAMIMAEGVYGWVTGGAIFYSGLEPSFKFIFGFIVLTLISNRTKDLPF